MNQRLGLDGLDYLVPVRAGQFDFMLGALTLVALVLLALTGVVLTQFFNPAVNGAHDSVRYILTGSAVVALLRDVHIWSASASLTLVFSHLVAVFWRGGFRRPREGMWWSGVLLLAVLFGLARVRCCLEIREPWKRSPMPQRPRNWSARWAPC
ncbi:MAG: cytochrome b N-terminal domain-containing protein [Gemmatimonadetes bacterium]|nr:cytochrome b N-terminal domain-containing protein [Gemmatimonadota bacterium]